MHACSHADYEKIKPVVNNKDNRRKIHKLINNNHVIKNTFISVNHGLSLYLS